LPGALGQLVGEPVIVAVGFAVMATLCAALETQPLAVTVTLSVVVPDAPTVNVMPAVLDALVIVPFVIVQAYVAPAMVGTLAERPAAFGQVAPAAVMTEEGTGLTATGCEPVVEQPAAVTCTLTTDVPAEPTENVIDVPPCPLVIVPFVMVQS
jgi:hypothetical protein